MKTASSPAFRTLCVAPMMAWTDRHCRYLLRLCSPNARLFTEMVTTGALLNGPRRQLLSFDHEEHPLVIQLGGCEPADLARAAAIAETAGFDEVNLNIGCPSPRVRKGRFGACLMREPELVAQCITAMHDACNLPVTAKIRLGVDDHDSDPLLREFVTSLVDAGCDALYLHARKAYLNGLSPAQNRHVPPLQPERAYALKALFPELPIVFNGGISCERNAIGHLEHLDGVMIGRAAYHDPMFLSRLDARLSGRAPVPLDTVVTGYLAYMDRQLLRGTRLHDMTRHMLGLFKGVPGARRYRRLLSDAARLKANDLDLVHEAIAATTAQAA
jgi:tRNA-dihydrouridine synthase A